jgi:Rrf2 family cysteine metabolism transcriptional repressor
VSVSQKCQYAVRAVLELAKRCGQGPVPISEIASKQAVPPRFLEIILNEMKQGGFVQSRRGVQGGYMLAMPPDKINVGQVIRFVDGPFDPVKCISEKAGKSACPLKTRCALVGLWVKAKHAIEEVYDSTTFQSLVEQEKALERASADFCI